MRAFSKSSLELDDGGGSAIPEYMGSRNFCRNEGRLVERVAAFGTSLTGRQRSTFVISKEPSSNEVRGCDRNLGFLTRISRFARNDRDYAFEMSGATLNS